MQIQFIGQILPEFDIQKQYFVTDTNVDAAAASVSDNETFVTRLECL